MAYDEYLAERVRRILQEKKAAFFEKKMMGGLTFMVGEKMCVGIVKEDLMVRVGAEKYPEALEKEGCRPMDFTGRPLTGYVFVSPEGVDLEEILEEWVQMALDFNPFAKASKKRKKKTDS